MRKAIIGIITRLREKSYVVGVSTLCAALELEGEDFDFVFIDPGLPGFNPLSRTDRQHVVLSASEAFPSAVQVVITGSYDFQEKENLLGTGTELYLSKIGLDSRQIEEIITKGEGNKYTKNISQEHEEYYSFLTDREQSIYNFVKSRRRTERIVDKYQQYADLHNISTDTVCKHYKNASKKIRTHA
ncbi:putative response regulator receiver protein [Roseibium sp. TrichSKD4]|nr:putative response regulator receiver protein [Roseibium sp. TrichSKD4]